MPRLVVSSGTLEGLKWLGLVLMTLDHINKHFFDAKLPGIYEAGRLCVPIFCFVLAYNLARSDALLRGTHLHAMKRLAIFGLIATPFVIGLGKLSWGWWPLNIMFMLLLATTLIYLIEVGGASRLIVAGALFFIAGFFVEFWWFALGICLSAWWYCKSPNKLALILFVASIASLYLVNKNSWALAALPLIFLAPLVDLKIPRIRYLFYVYYPAHLAVLLGFKLIS